MHSDIVQGKSSSFTASPVMLINGQNASEYLESYSSGTVYHDADARYNTVFENPALKALGSGQDALFRVHYVYDGPNTTLTFANDTYKIVENLATIGLQYDFSKVKDGPSFFEAFCQGPHEPPRPTAYLAARASAPPMPTATPSSSPSPRLLGYPQPVFIQDSGSFSGYYPTEKNYNDVAVLAIPTFRPITTDSRLDSLTAGFVQTQQLLQKFFANSLKQDKERLVIDLRGNGGGTIDMGFELFRQLFPTIEPFGATRYRAHEAFHYYSAIVADLAVAGINEDGIMTADWDDADYGTSSAFLWSNILDVKRQSYKSYADYFGPYILHNDSFTGVRRYNVSIRSYRLMEKSDGLTLSSFPTTKADILFP